MALEKTYVPKVGAKVEVSGPVLVLMKAGAPCHEVVPFDPNEKSFSLIPRGRRKKT
jgi:hypothetical protein